jgi:hypothetical protein
MVAWLMNAVVNIARLILACVALSILLSVRIQQASNVLALVALLENVAKISARLSLVTSTTTWWIRTDLVLLALLAPVLIVALQPLVPTMSILDALPVLQVGFLDQTRTQRTFSARESATSKFAVFL